MKFKVGTYTKKQSQGIYTVDYQMGNAKLELSYTVDNPTYLDLHKHYVFTVVKEGSKGGIAFYNEGKFVNQVTEEGAPPCYVSYDDQNKLVYASNYHGGRVNSYKMIDGLLVAHETIQYVEGSKAHYIKYDDFLNQVLVCNLGNDEVYFYSVVDQSLVLKNTYKAPKGSGPRHLVVDSKHAYVYVFTELSSEIIVLSVKDSGIEEVQKISTLPTDYDSTKWGAAIRMSNDHQNVYVSNRAHDSITVFKTSTQGLEWVENVPSHGVQPRDFNLSLDDQYLVIANHDTNNLTVYKRDPLMGQLSLIQKDIECPEGVCIVFEE
jgi:6-phosphogluconolactonase